MTNIEFTRNFIEPNKFLQYTLSIRITSDGFCFCILDNSNRKFIFLKSTAMDSSSSSVMDLLKQQIAIEPLFNQPVQKTVITFCNPHYTLLPEELFEADKKEIFFSFAQPLSKTDMVQHEKITGTDIYCIYAVPDDLQQLLQQKFPQATTTHRSAILTKEAILQSVQKQNREMHIHVCNNFFYATIADNGKLLLSNSFAFENETEFTYFIMSLVEKFSIDVNNTPILFSGNMDKDGKEIELLKSYIKPAFDESLPNYTFIPPFEEIEKHKFSKLFMACEL